MPPRDHGVPMAEDQLPLYSRVGRGPKGDSYKVRIASDSESATYLEGLARVNGSNVWTRDWLSENINGGKLSYTLVTNGDADNPEFQITFDYRRDGRTEWTLTTPPIPYDGSGSGEWPDVAELIDAALEHVHIDMGFGDNLKGDDPNGYTIKEYIDGLGDDLLTHFHTDLGFPANVMVMAGDGGTVEPNTVYEYIQSVVGDILEHLHLDLGWEAEVFEGDGNETDPNSVKDFLEAAIADHDHDLGDITTGWPLLISHGGTAVAGDGVPMTANVALNNFGLTFGATPWTKLWGDDNSHLVSDGHVEISNLQKYRLFAVLCRVEDHNEEITSIPGNYRRMTNTHYPYTTHQCLLIGYRNKLQNRTYDYDQPEVLTAVAGWDTGTQTYAYVATFYITDATNITLHKASRHLLSGTGVTHETLCVHEIWGIL